jgi:HEAT repeat protein
MRSLILAALAVVLAFQDKTTTTTPDTALKEFKQAYVKAGQNASARADAVRGLGRAPHSKTMAALAQVLLGDGSGKEVEEVRIAAAETIGASFAKIPNSWKPLAAVAKTNDRKIAEIRISSAKAMKQIADPASLKTMQDLVDDKPFEVAKEAVDGLALIPSKNSVPLLIKLLREVERIPEDQIVPELPFHGLGAGGPALDDARTEQIVRRKVLYNPVLDSLKSLTGQDFTTFKEYQKWWSAKGSSFQVEKK